MTASADSVRNAVRTEAADRPTLSSAATVVVVGGGHAGAAVVAQLRTRGFRGALHLVSDELALPYHRPPLSKQALGGAVDATALAIRPASWYVEHAVTTHLGCAVTGIDRGARQLRLHGGGVACLGYDALVLATGVAPRPLALVSAGAAQGIFTLRDAPDAAALGAALSKAQRIVVIGGGYIGLEVAASARGMGVAVCVVEQAPRLLARVAPAPVADAIAALHEARGVTVYTGAQVDAVEQSGDGAVAAVRVRDRDGAVRLLPADVLVVGIGGVPRDALAREAGLVVDNGIVVDDEGQSSDERIFAIGDVARVRGRAVRLESVANANEMAARVAVRLLGQSPGAWAVPWFWSEQYGARLQTAGLSTDSDDWVTRREGNGWSVWSFRRGALVAVDAWQAPLAYALGKKWLEAGRTPTAAWLAEEQHALKDWQETDAT